MDSVHRPDIDSDSLKRENSGAVSDMSVRYAGLDRHYRHGVAIGLNMGRPPLIVLDTVSSCLDWIIKSDMPSERWIPCGRICVKPIVDSLDICNFGGDGLSREHRSYSFPYFATHPRNRRPSGLGAWAGLYGHVRFLRTGRRKREFGDYPCCVGRRNYAA